MEVDYQSYPPTSAMHPQNICPYGRVVTCAAAELLEDVLVESFEKESLALMTVLRKTLSWTWSLIVFVRRTILNASVRQVAGGSSTPSESKNLETVLLV